MVLWFARRWYWRLVGRHSDCADVNELGAGVLEGCILYSMIRTKDIATGPGHIRLPPTDFDEQRNHERAGHLPSRCSTT